jgi:hypothetical protein
MIWGAARRRAHVDAAVAANGEPQAFETYQSARVQALPGAW